MARNTQSFFLTNHPFHLWIGTSTALHQEIQQDLCKVWCHHGCNVCMNCLQIRAHQHANVLWITPEKQYTLQELEPLFDKVRFQCGPDEVFFCILDKAETLNHACANKLLKVLEEPPRGYHVIMLASGIDNLPATIRSRALIRVIPDKDVSLEETVLWTHLSTQAWTDPLCFHQALDRLTMTEQECLILINNLAIKWANVYIKSVMQEKACKHAYTIASLLHQIIAEPLPPGGSKIILRDVFLTIKIPAPLVVIKSAM